MSYSKVNYEIVKKSNLLNKKWYLENYNDVKILGMDPIVHYLKYGSKMKRDPSLNFSSQFYREEFMEENSSEDPLLHYLKIGLKKGYKYRPNALHLRDLLRNQNAEKAKYLSQFCSKTIRETFPVIEMAIAESEKGYKGCEYAETLSKCLFEPKEMQAIDLREEHSGKDFFIKIYSNVANEIDGELITVILPAYNSEDTIEKSIKSILNQSWRNIQLIVVDDCSSDATFDKAQEIARTDSRMKLLRNKKNVGPYVSKNIALKYAKGKYITGQDADDWSHPQRFEKHMQMIKKDGDVKASMAYMFRMKMDGTIEVRREGLLIGSSISTMYESEFLRTKLGHWDCARFGADSEMISRAKKILGDDFKYYKFPSMICLAAPNSLTSNPEYGVSVEHGLSPARLEYRSAWTEWHQTINENQTYLPFPHEVRMFSIPDHAYVSINDIKMNIESESL
ncbi:MULTISPECIES: glycosyltransferase family 2 protein [Halomonadaceae]|uniref:glycosyltransferase family 2 protein n=1 Tax=Halomonadaceae TaxID=28256 RepID=UPI0012F2EEEE|nr:MULTISPECIES: glycosyltransferase family A protein [Halomonas]CAD5264974.1 putative Glycosyltransferase family 2 protein [Halomonas sp. 156]CAD5266019.1 putative Glycosyltransferase family 2 protein [Halomonas sp. I3]CAD5283729.1 putative Glycosyltransferase family 2 protein [Halomonas sp. 113]CAD5285163.1 putative Glycosyltransferase family 2 protein [Halomonas sp. 59]VXB25152.1 putative Glycosyltransferase family 2 protein [Halomonas titanicae]